MENNGLYVASKVLKPSPYDEWYLQGNLKMPAYPCIILGKSLKKSVAHLIKNGGFLPCPNFKNVV